MFLQSAVHMENSTFSANNSTGTEGGGAIEAKGQLTGKHLAFENNSALTGGSISVQAGGTVSLENSHFLKSRASQDGGDIVLTGISNLDCTLCTFRGSKAEGYGGAISGSPVSLMVLNNTTFEDLSTGIIGGAVYSLGRVMITSSMFARNSGDRGGAVALDTSTDAAATKFNVGVIINNSAFINNTASQGGGALYLGAGRAGSCNNCSFHSNTASFGGAVLVDEGTDFAFNTCDLAHNIARQGGGGGILQGGSEWAVTVTGSEVVSNTAQCCYAAAVPAIESETCFDISLGFGTELACCQAGQYIQQDVHSGRYTCTTCDPTTMVCDKGGLAVQGIPLQSGYWRESLETTNIKKCFHAAACNGGAPSLEATADAYCAEGYQGPYCAVCSDGYTSVYGYACTSCDSSGAALGIFLRVLVMVFILLLAVWLFVGGAMRYAAPAQLEAQPRSAAKRSLNAFILSPATYVLSLLVHMRIPIVVLQVITKFLSVTGVPLPAVYEKFLRYLQFVNLDWSWLLSIGCYLKVNFYDELLLATLTPLAVAAIIFVPRLLVRCCSARMTDRMHAALESFAARDLRILLVLAFLIFGGVSSTILETFGCESFPTINERFLRADYAISCNTSTYKSYRAYAAFMLVVYPIGIPALFALLLSKARDEVRGPGAAADVPADAENEQQVPLNDMPQPYVKSASQFLAEPYRDSTFFWEVTECMRRLLLTGILIFILPGTTGQSAVASTLAFMAVLLYCSIHPHKLRSDRAIYILGGSIIFLTYFTALLMQSEWTDSQSESVISILLILLNVALVVAPILQGALVIYLHPNDKSFRAVVMDHEMTAGHNRK
eukprot:TRINITY_DN507_c0_g1_i5.p1 TRINITY_DN507_c0_g1~~TRINITY_DN507_c0_g1_i5.p1  ORF type:complete len:835 (-),score=189.38 TRINITY_DN507_c0_g1_i5:172-2676(-)